VRRFVPPVAPRRKRTAPHERGRPIPKPSLHRNQVKPRYVRSEDEVRAGSQHHYCTSIRNSTAHQYETPNVAEATFGVSQSLVTLGARSPNASVTIPPTTSGCASCSEQPAKDEVASNHRRSSPSVRRVGGCCDRSCGRATIGPSRDTWTADSRSANPSAVAIALARARVTRPRASPPSLPMAAMCARSRLTTSPPRFPATLASSEDHSCAVPLAWAARPPLLAISR
jgi:hypothetical protein